MNAALTEVASLFDCNIEFADGRIVVATADDIEVTLPGDISPDALRELLEYGHMMRALGAQEERERLRAAVHHAFGT